MCIRYITQNNLARERWDKISAQEPFSYNIRCYFSFVVALVDSWSLFSHLTRKKEKCKRKSTSHLGVITMFWSCNPLDLTVDWDSCPAADRDIKTSATLTTSDTACVFLFLRITEYSEVIVFSIFFPPFLRDDDVDAYKKIEWKEILILDHSSGYITPQTSLWITETNCFLATIPTRGRHVHSARRIPEESGYLMKKRLFCSASIFLLSSCIRAIFAHYSFFMLLRNHTVYSKEPVYCFWPLDQIPDWAVAPNRAAC